MMNKHGGDIYGYPGVVDFSANINYLGMPQAVKAAAMRGVEESVHYPQAAHRQLRHAVAKRYHIEEEQILCGNGAAELIYCLVEALQPKRALVMAPSFSEYEEALDSCGCEVLRYLLKKEDAFCPDDGFIRQIQPSIDMVFVCNPNNPTGGLVSISYIEEVCRMCEKEGAILVVDESFLEFVSQAVSARALLKKYENIIILQSFTKIYAMPGLRLGCAFCGKESMVELLQKRLQPWNVSLPAQYAGIAAMQEKEYVEASAQLIAREREFLTEQLRLAGLENGVELIVYEGAANFLLFYGPELLWQYCLEEGVLLRDCSNFEGLGKGWFRTAVRGHEENGKLIEAVRKACGRLQTKGDNNG